MHKQLENDTIVASFARPFLPVNLVCANCRGEGRCEETLSVEAVERITGWDGCVVD